jgi:biopolymer transport protein ExbB/biopolymer transport protein TolQ
MLIQKLLAVAEIGSRVVLYVLLALSVVSISIIVERWWYFRKRRINTRVLAKSLLDKLKADDREGAAKLLTGTRGVEAEVLKEALAWWDQGPEAVEEILQNGFKERRGQVESGLLFLGTLGNNAPFIGLFGTVLGVVTAFRELGVNAAGQMGNVMSGIAEALIATAVGILVALPAVVAYNFFQKKSADVEENVSSLGNVLLAQMKGELHAAAQVATKQMSNGRSLRLAPAADKTAAESEA